MKIGTLDTVHITVHTYALLQFPIENGELKRTDK